MPPLAPSVYPYGPFDNLVLVQLAARLRGFGISEAQVRKQAFAPFIIAGPARWENTWGAPRRDPDGTLRRHLGQDVFCDFGAPVLAAERGRIEFGRDRLGGLVARLHRDRGGYFYYAHLSGFNDDRFSSGDRVSVGDVIGYCGNSGNAKGTTPHVHLGYYSGGAQDPMGFLLEWHDRAQRRAHRTLRALVGAADLSEFARRLGDELVPDPVVGPPLAPRGSPIEILLDAALGRFVPADAITAPASPPDASGARNR
jgi:murein DD-endopeptidase MepM/ murein hydrolase activator NlpD